MRFHRVANGSRVCCFLDLMRLMTEHIVAYCGKKVFHTWQLLQCLHLDIRSAHCCLIRLLILSSVGSILEVLWCRISEIISCVISCSLLC